MKSALSFHCTKSAFITLFCLHVAVTTTDVVVCPYIFPGILEKVTKATKKTDSSTITIGIAFFLANFNIGTLGVARCPRAIAPILAGGIHTSALPKIGECMCAGYCRGSRRPSWASVSLKLDWTALRPPMCLCRKEIHCCASALTILHRTSNIPRCLDGNPFAFQHQLSAGWEVFTVAAASIDLLIVIWPMSCAALWCHTWGTL